MAERRNDTPSVEDSTRLLGRQGSSGAIPNQRERSESRRRGGSSGGEVHHLEDVRVSADTAEGSNDNQSPQAMNHQQDAQHLNQSSTSRRHWCQMIVRGCSRTPRRQREGQEGRAETPGYSAGRSMFSSSQRTPAVTTPPVNTSSANEEKGEEQNPLRGDDPEREQTSATPGTPLLGRQQGDSEHTNQNGRARSGTRAQGERTWMPFRQRAARARQEEGRQEHTMNSGRRNRFAICRSRAQGIQQVDARRDHRPAGLDLNPFPPGGSHGDSTREEKTAEFDDAVESNHPPSLAITPRHSRRIFHDGAQTPGRARSAPVRPRLRDQEEEVIAQRRARWEKAVAAVNLRATRDKDEVDEVHWPDRVEPEDVYIQAPLTSKVRVTLFLQTGQRAREHANVLKTIFPHSAVLVSQKSIYFEFFVFLQ